MTRSITGNNQTVELTETGYYERVIVVRPDAGASVAVQHYKNGAWQTAVNYAFTTTDRIIVKNHPARLVFTGRASVDLGPVVYQDFDPAAPEQTLDKLVLKGLPQTPDAPAGYGDLASVVGRNSQQAKYSPNVVVDFTDPNTPLPAITSGSPTLSFGICPHNGKRGLRYTSPGGTSSSISFPQLAGMRFDNQAYITTYDNNIAYQQNLQFRAYDTPSTFWGMQNVLNIPSDGNGPDVTGGANVRTFNTSHRAAQGSPTTAAFFVLQDVRIVFPTSAEPVDMWIFNIGFGQPRKGRICVVWDDGRRSSLQLGAPLLNSYGIRKQTMAMITNRVGATADAVTLGQCRSFVNGGGSIVAHSPSSPNMIDEFPANPVAAANSILRCISYIKDLGLETPRYEKCFVYSQGKYQATAFDTSYLEAMKGIGIDIARISWMNQIRQQRNFDSHTRLGRLACTTIGHQYMGAAGTTPEAENVAEVIARINQVSDFGLDCFLMLHSVTNGPNSETGPYDISTTNLTLIAEAIKANVDAGKLEAVTMPELVIDGDNYWNQF